MVEVGDDLAHVRLRLALAQQVVDEVLGVLPAHDVVVAGDVRDRRGLPTRVQAEERDLAAGEVVERAVGGGQRAEQHQDRVRLGGDGILELVDQRAGIALRVGQVHLPSLVVAGRLQPLLKPVPGALVRLRRHLLRHHGEFHRLALRPRRRAAERELGKLRAANRGDADADAMQQGAAGGCGLIRHRYPPRCCGH